ncbi:MAG: hypothetical protein KME10_11385 [Plectolyngbya sp. WJT66-NPBG17]|nr:hypothetical protein [Plectolyngbya sp. WJT66-NPBG17]
MKPFVINKRFAVRMSFTFLLLIGTTVHQTSLQRWQSDLAASQEKANRSKTDEQDSRARIKSLSSDSTIALERVKAGCLPIVLTSNNRPARFQASSRVFDTQTFPANPKTPRFDQSGNPINGVRPLPEGLIICNGFGDTAIVGFDGAISDIKRVQPSHLAEFLTHYNRKQQEKSN